MLFGIIVLIAKKRKPTDSFLCLSLFEATALGLQARATVAWTVAPRLGKLSNSQSSLFQPENQAIGEEVETLSPRMRTLNDLLKLQRGLRVLIFEPRRGFNHKVTAREIFVLLPYRGILSVIAYIYNRATLALSRVMLHWSAANTRTNVLFDLPTKDWNLLGLPRSHALTGRTFKCVGRVHYAVSRSYRRSVHKLKLLRPSGPQQLKPEYKLS